MDFLRRLFLQTQNHLRDLTLSQRLAIGSCAALIVVSLMWLVQWASDPELVALLDQPIPAQELSLIEQRLSAMDVPYKVFGGTLMVPPERRPRLLAQLSQTEALPKDISAGFDNLIKESSPWIGSGEQHFRRTVALSNELAKVIREFEGVQEARVFIDRQSKRTVAGASLMPTASVFLKLDAGLKLDKRLTAAVASLVSRAVVGLDVTRVAVTDARTHNSMHVPARDELTAEDDLEHRQMQEQYYAEQIQSVLANIPGLLVAVHAELDHEARNEVHNEYTKPTAIREKTESSTKDRAAPAGAPGVVANTAKAVTPGGSGERFEENRNDSEYETKIKSTVTVVSPRRAIKRLTASVNVPRSYLAAIFRQANGKEPTDADLTAGAQPHLKKISDVAASALGVQDDAGAVVVEWFHDEAAVQMGNIVEAGPGSDFLAMARTYGSKAGIGALGVVSLFMMLMMVRRVGNGPVLPGEEPPKPQIIRIFGSRSQPQQQGDREADTLVVGTPPVGEAEAREQLLVGREVDESTLRAQQVIDQVTDMIRDDPELTAGILQRWIDAEKQ